jgi:hypothetical protein
MGYSSFLRSPKKEEQEVPDSSVLTKFSDTKTGCGDEEELHIMDDLKGIWGIEEDENLAREETVLVAVVVREETVVACFSSLSLSVHSVKGITPNEG